VTVAYSVAPLGRDTYIKAPAGPRTPPTHTARYVPFGLTGGAAPHREHYTVDDAEGVCNWLNERAQGYPKVAYLDGFK
jgi:hypothetical protein